MAKFFITNNRDLYNTFIKRVDKSAFSIGSKIENGNIFAITVKKLRLDNVNGWSRVSNFAITTGTPIYKESLDNESLIDDFDGDVNQIRRHFIGQYGAAIHKEGKTIVFCDAVGTYSVYYYKDDSDYLVGTDISDMAAVLGDRVKPSEINILEEACQNSILCGDSLYEGIKRLSGHECLVISDGVLEVSALAVQKRLEGMSTDECAKHLVQQFKYKAGVIAKVLGDPDIFMTGGLDARISLASYLSVGAKPTLHYGVGNSFVTNTKHDDLEIARSFAKRYDLPLYEEDWSTPSPLYRDWDKYIQKYGVLAKNYAASDSIMKCFENLPNNVSTFGYGGELYRNLPWIENRKKDFFTAEEFVDEYYIGGTQSHLMTSEIEGYRDRIVAKVKALCKEYGFDPEHIDNKDNVYLLIEYRRYADTMLLNMMNQIRYSNLLLFEQDCLELTDVHVEDMKQSKFMLNIINHLYADVLEVPIFSHCQKREYDKEIGVLKEAHKSLKKRIYGAIPKNVKTLVKQIMHNENHSNLVSNVELTDVIQSLDFYPGFKISPTVDFRYLIHYALIKEAAYAYGVKI